jgi:hypothetical protein
MEVIAPTSVLCPTCGAQHVHEHSLRDAGAGEHLWIGRCENQHWWLRSLVFGRIPIDPGTMAVARVTTMEDEGERRDPLLPLSS